jgi:enolase-phosphatase E1
MDDPVIGEVARLAPDQPIVETLLGWMDRDEKITPLKTIQGMIWAEGYAKGEITGDVYPDVPPALKRWAKAGVKLFVYSSGSVSAQKLLFGHAAYGDLTPLFQGFFDTRVGPKRDAKSYELICRGTNISAVEFLFLSDVEAELDAATGAGLRSCQLVRAGDGTIPSTRHATAADFADVARQCGLPAIA